MEHRPPFLGQACKSGTL